ncbi:putative bifunctional diguanylate cyclase/phosphodiesterase [Robinsoniella sp. KNHs210]|uniref:putative bifunctional diguanylate cyclase/phosphodiesterase n=1 Tax=Robinsoniella sp. KNHs210 TaxID=1469950 RepID=UPI0004840BCF|nr:GGDEF domain-containing phosphodiesterase [Robinsoniella sp. KNHs210]
MDQWNTDRIIDNMDAFVYAIRYDTHQFLYTNKVMREKFPELQKDITCHKLFFCSDEVCKDCPMGSGQGENNVRSVMWIESLQQWLQLDYSAYQDEKLGFCFVCIGVDITSVKESIRMTKTVLDGIHAAAYTVGMEDYRISFVNQELRNMLPDIQEKDLCYQALWNNQKPCSHCPIPHLNEDNPSRKMEIYNEKLNKYLSIDSVRVLGSDSKPVAIFTGYDISKRIAYENQLKDTLFKDMQLGIKNRASFMEDLSMLFQDGKNGCVCILNMKNFNNYNLVFGRQQGDALLKLIVERCVEIYPKHRVYRVGGAKFAFLASCEEQCNLIREKIVKAIQDESHKNGQNFRLFIDVVLIDFPQYAPNPEMVIHNAEYMLSKAKNTESSEVLYFRKTEQIQMERKNQIAGIIREKAAEQSFEVYYQPIYEIESGTYTKCEALLRVKDKKLGWISPSEFIPIAEQSGLINQLGVFVLEEACRMIAEREKMGLDPVQINVNVSTVQFSKSTFYDDVTQVVQKYHIDPALIQLEVTESIIINSFDYIINIMRRLIEFGVSFAIDDFGTGYSSLSYIGTLPVESIKLDKSFVDKIAESEVYLLIVKNVIEIAKGLQFQIVAEGVEGRNQYEILKRLDCDYIQGYFFSTPLPPEEFEQFLEKETVLV